MVAINTFKQLALSFAGAEEQPHFEKTSFRVKKKIFATHAADSHIICVKLSEIDQSVFCAFDKTIIYPVDNKWGKQGWTLVDLKKIRKEMLIDILPLRITRLGKRRVVSSEWRVGNTGKRGM